MTKQRVPNMFDVLKRTTHSSFLRPLQRYQLVVISLLALILVGCTPKDSNSGVDNDSDQDNSASIEIQIQNDWSGTNSDTTVPKQEIIRNVDNWKTAWELAHKNETPAPGLPQVDFEKNMVLVVFMGTKNSGGYSTKITKIVKLENGIEVTVEEESPGKDEATTQALTSPFHFAEVEKSEGEIKFVIN